MNKVASLVLTLVAFASLACGSSVSFLMNNGEIVSGQVAGSDAENVYVDDFRGPMTLQRAEIDIIDHPGNVMGNVGLGVAALGGMIMLDARSGESDDLTLYSGAAAVATGALLLVLGYSNWWQSRLRLDGMALDPSREGDFSLHRPGFSAEQIYAAAYSFRF